jgi:uncharacterized protein (TIGR03435 family)
MARSVARDMTRKTASAAVCSALAVMMWLHAALVAQAPSSEENNARFDVASIKPNKTDSRGISGANFVMKGRYTVINYPLWLLVGDAFGLQRRDQVVGGPDWIEAAKYDISAITDIVTPTRAQHRALVRHLLEERFSLRAHQETRETDVYDLVLLREDGVLGAGLRPSTVDCKALAESGKGRCSWSASGFTHRATAQPIQMLMVQLFSSVDRRIVDRTGLKGSFDWELKLASDPNDPSAPSVFTALQEQLGLKLVPNRGMLEVVVIDHIQPPTPD